MQLTAEQLAASTGAPVQRAQKWVEFVNEALGLFDIQTAARAAMFLAQIGHESGHLVYVREIWGPTPAQTRYEGRLDLGNTVVGDGRRFLGRGLIQLTGRANAARIRNKLRERLGPVVPDFELHPEELEKPRWAALASGQFWADKGLNKVADSGDFLLCCQLVNGGAYGKSNGLAERKALWAQARKALGLPELV